MYRNEQVVDATVDLYGSEGWAHRLSLSPVTVPRLLPLIAGPPAAGDGHREQLAARPWYPDTPLVGLLQVMAGDHR